MISDVISTRSFAIRASSCCLSRTRAEPFAKLLICCAPSVSFGIGVAAHDVGQAHDLVDVVDDLLAHRDQGRDRGRNLLDRHREGRIFHAAERLAQLLIGISSRPGVLIVHGRSRSPAHPRRHRPGRTPCTPAPPQGVDLASQQVDLVELVGVLQARRARARGCRAAPCRRPASGTGNNPAGPDAGRPRRECIRSRARPTARACRPCSRFPRTWRARACRRRQSACCPCRRDTRPWCTRRRCTCETAPAPAPASNSLPPPPN